MSLLLSIETSSEVGSIAIHKEGELIFYKENLREKSHSENIAQLIKSAYDELGLLISETEYVAISKGPGSYTGLRIGTSIAKGICYGSDASLISVGTLEAMAAEYLSDNPVKKVLCPMLDARRMEVYCQLFDSEMEPITPVEARVIDEHSFQEILKEGGVVFFGSGSTKCESIIKHSNASFDGGRYPKASFIGHIALSKIRAGEFEDVAYFEPFYLKEFIAKKPSKKNMV